MDKCFSRDQARGMLVGLAVGDALGTTLEFTTRDTVRPIDDMVGGGPFGPEPGQWTDDTSMALCLGDALRAIGRWDPDLVMRRIGRGHRPDGGADQGVRGDPRRMARTAL